MKHLPGIVFLLMLLMSPSLSWAEETSAGGSGEASAEQTGSDGKPVNAEKKKKAKKAGSTTEEEPDCE